MAAGRLIPLNARDNAARAACTGKIAMSGIDRGEQKQILEALKELYPNRLDTRSLPNPDVAANVAYLQEHGLVEAKWSGAAAGPALVKITARGIDFLADDGGLSAILGVLTVRLHEDSLKALLLERVDASDEPDTVKSKFKEQIRALPAEAMKTTIMELLKGLLANAPDAMHWLQRSLGP
jgi:hypothetical protein